MLGGIQQLRGPNFIQFWPQPPSSGQKWTFYLLSTLCHVTQRGLSTYTHPPLLVHVVIEWPYDCSCAGEASAFLRLWGTRPLSTMRSKPIPSRNSICRRKIISVDIQWWKKIVKFLNCFSALWDLTSFCLYRKRTENFAREKPCRQKNSSNYDGSIVPWLTTSGFDKQELFLSTIHQV